MSHTLSKYEKKDIELIFKEIDYDLISEKTHDLLISFEDQFIKYGWLSEKQREILADIHSRYS